MPIIRIEKHERYTIIDNEIVNDKRLSAEAFALIVYLLSKPNDWKTNRTNLQNRFEKNSKNKIKTAFAELVSCGYAKLTPTRDVKGKLTGQEYVIYDYPPSKQDIPRTEIFEPRKTSSLGNPSSLINTDISILTTNKEISSKFKSSEFNNAWKDFVEVRKEIRHKITPTQQKKLIAKLEKHTEQEAIFMLTTSAENGWQGIFPPKSNNGKKAETFEEKWGITT